MDGIDRYRRFVQNHHQQLITSQVPEPFWQMLYRKLTNQIFDAGEAFSLYLIDYSDDVRQSEDPVWTLAVSKEDGIKHTDPTEIYVIDHAWTFRFDMARRQLQQIPDLLRRMSMIMGVDLEELGESGAIEQVMTDLWRYCQMYAISTSTAANAQNDETTPELSVEDRMPIWYVMDELGSGITHSDKPNFRVIPFIFMDDGSTYSILFPIADCAKEEYVTRDFVEGSGTTDEDVRSALLLPWQHCSFADRSYEQHEPDMEYFLAGHIEESLPLTTATSPVVNRNRPLRVYATYRYVNEYLTDAAFELVDNEGDADILWLTGHFKKFSELSESAPNKFVNQFPFENCITIKDLLSIVCRRMGHQHSCPKSLQTYPLWLPTTYNLKTELIEFVAYYQQRERLGLDNHWIVKPWNLARGLGMYVTKDLAQIMRLQPTGPKIVQKYIERPLLFYRPECDGNVKFDVRYVLLVTSVQPLTAYIYRNFFLRFANKPFALSKFDDYEQHFTVMNYQPEFQMRHLPCAEFLQMWTEQYPAYEWDDIERDICVMLKEMLMGAATKQPPCGIGASPQSRALYAADIMLEWAERERVNLNGTDKDDGVDNDGEQRRIIQPKLLEMNFVPDCKRACEYYPEFFNDVFKLLFLDDVNENVFTKITA